MRQNIIIRRNPFVMLKQIIILEIIIGMIYIAPILLERNNIIIFGATEIYSQLYFVLITIALQILIVSMVFIRWYLTQYILTKNKIVIKNNFIYNQEVNYKLENITSLTLAQTLFNKIFSSGKIIGKDSEGNELFILKDIPDPAYHLSLIEQKADKKESSKIPFCDKKNLKTILKNGESQCVEFKTSLLWDSKKKTANKDLQHAVMKTITGFMNTQGGILIIGVNDKAEVVGLEDDIKNMKKKNLDGFENLFNMIFTNMIGLEFRNYIDSSFEKAEKKDICIINVKPSKKPVYLKNKKEEEFYIRAGNTTHPLQISEATRYVEENFNGKK